MSVPTKKSLSAPAASLTPEKKIKTHEVQPREANEKAQLFEVVIDALKKGIGVLIEKKPSGKSSPKKAPPEVERGEGLPLLGRQPSAPYQQLQCSG
ncbi:hypothetical protein GmRootV118_65670 [Variovorax sp. V118]|uniref:hypothetical protein n=1 Tax=Variovorax sp. V118 TaxID=3065954 RepID=UPI0034E8CEB8